MVLRVLERVTGRLSSGVLLIEGGKRLMLTRKQDELFSHAARLALRGAHAVKSGSSALEPLLANWSELEHLATRAQAVAARRVAANIFESLTKRRASLQKNMNSDALRSFGQECVLLFKLGRGDDPTKLPLEFGEYY